MKNIKETCSSLLSSTFETKLLYGNLALSSLLKVLPNESNEQKGMSNWIIVGFCFNIIASDGEISDKEVEYFNALMSTDYDKESIKTKLSFFQEESNELLDTITDYKEEIKDNFLMLAICFASSDGEISEEEISLLEKING